MDHTSHYPEEVRSSAKILTSSLVEEGFFEDYDLLPEIGMPLLHKNFCSALLQKWLADGEVSLSEDEFTDALRKTITETILEGLKRKGLIDTIENENGEEVIFLTGAGKEAALKIAEEANGL